MSETPPTPPPVTPPPATPPPATPPPTSGPVLRRPGPFLRLLAWLTEPTLIKGISLGVVMSLVVMVANKLDALWYAVSGVLVVLVALLFGAIVGHYVFEGRKRRLQKNASGLLAEAGAVLPALSEDLLALVQSRDRHHLHALWARLGRVRPAMRELALLGVAMAFRVMAMSSLFAVLGGAISFAVFLATYLQVERMGEQNVLLRSQNEMVRAELRAVHEQSNVDAALSVAAQRQTIVLGLMNAVDAEIALRREVRLQSDGEDAGDARERARLSSGTYRRITRTLAQLQPYYAVEPIIGETVELAVGEGEGARVRIFHRISADLRSPEQEMLVRFLEGSRIDLSQVILRRAFLDGADLRELELPKIDLSESSFARADLGGTDLSEAYLEGASFAGATLEKAILMGAKLGKAKFRRARLVGADLSEAALGEADLTLADLRTATLDKANLDGAILAGVDLTDADMVRAKLKGADLTGADLSAVNKAPAIDAIKSAKGWWLAAQSDDVADKLGLPRERNAANKAAVQRLKAPGLDEAAALAILDELRRSAPEAPAG